MVVVARSDQPWRERGRAWNTSALPVPTDLLVYTQSEWREMMERGGRFAEALEDEAVWVYLDEAERELP